MRSGRSTWPARLCSASGSAAAEPQHLLGPHPVAEPDRRGAAPRRLVQQSPTSAYGSSVSPQPTMSMPRPAGRRGHRGRVLEPGHDQRRRAGRRQHQAGQPLERQRVVAGEVAQVGAGRQQQRVDARAAAAAAAALVEAVRREERREVGHVRRAYPRTTVCALAVWPGDRHLMLLDSASLYFRAFYGVPETVVAPDGTPVNAVRGLPRHDRVPGRQVPARPPGRLHGRRLAARPSGWPRVPSYKAHRVAPAGGEEVPDTLSPQVPVLQAALDGDRHRPARASPGYEADDVIGTLATRARRAGRHRHRRPRPVPAGATTTSRCASSTPPRACATCRRSTRPR